MMIHRAAISYQRREDTAAFLEVGLSGRKGKDAAVTVEYNLPVFRYQALHKWMGYTVW